MHIRTILGWAVVIGLGWYLLTQPSAAGNAVHTALHSITTFLTSLTS